MTESPGVPIVVPIPIKPYNHTITTAIDKAIGTASTTATVKL